MAARDTDAAFDAGTIERKLSEFRATNQAVEALFRAHMTDQPPSDLDRETLEEAINALKHTIAVALHHGNHHVEYLYAREKDGEIEWYSATTTSDRTVRPIALYDHNVDERVLQYPLSVVHKSESPFSDRELGPHGLDAERDGVILDV